MSSRFLRCLRIALVGSALLGACDASKVESAQRLADGINFANAGDTSRAVQSIQEAIGLDPSNSEAHFALGTLRLQRFSDPAGALTSLEQAVTLDPVHAEARYQLAVALLAVGRTEDGRLRLEESVGLDPEHPGALYRLAALLDEGGDVRAAIDMYTRSILADPYFPLPYNGLGNLYVRYGRPQEAIQVFQNGIDNCVLELPEFASGSGMNRADLGRVYTELGELDLAVTYLKSALDFSAVSAGVQFNLGVALLRRSRATGSATDRADAQAYLERARAQCNPAVEQARCDSIAAALADLRTLERVP